MQNYTIGEDYILPSLGSSSIYAGGIDPHIKIRSMTTEEEMKRMSNSEFPYKNMSEIIDDCLIEGPDISAYDMCIGDYQFLLHKLRVVTYGSAYPVVNKCVYCGSNTEDIIDLEELPILEYSDEIENYMEFDLPKTGSHVTLNVQTPRMLDIVNNKIKEARRRSKNSSVDLSLIYTLMELVRSVDNEILNPSIMEQWLRNLPMADTNRIIMSADKINESIGIDTRLFCECDVCGLTFETGLKTTSEFFRPALNA